MNTEHKALDYNVGALVVLVISIGVAVVVYSMNVIPLNILNIPAWLLGPLGVYTIVFSFMAGKESTYYLVWGIIMSAVAAASAFYNVVNAFLVLGILLIVVAVIGIVAYWRGKK